jgi:hypothetical protein
LDNLIDRVFKAKKLKLGEKLVLLKYLTTYKDEAMRPTRIAIDCGLTRRGANYAVGGLEMAKILKPIVTPYGTAFKLVDCERIARSRYIYINNKETEKQVSYNRDIIIYYIE